MDSMLACSGSGVLATLRTRKCLPSVAYYCRNDSACAIIFALWSLETVCGTHRAHKLRNPNYENILDTDPLDRLESWVSSFTVARLSSNIAHLSCALLAAVPAIAGLPLGARSLVCPLAGWKFSTLFYHMLHRSPPTGDEFGHLAQLCIQKSFHSKRNFCVDRFSSRSSIFK